MKQTAFTDTKSGHKPAHPLSLRTFFTGKIPEGHIKELEKRVPRVDFNADFPRNKTLDYTQVFRKAVNEISKIKNRKERLRALISCSISMIYEEIEDKSYRSYLFRKHITSAAKFLSSIALIKIHKHDTLHKSS